MALKDTIRDDMKAAMRAKEKQRLSAIRMLLAAIQQEEISSRADLDDPQTQRIVDKLIKQRRDSISQYGAAGRDDLVAVEQFELEVLSAYMPEQASEDDVKKAVADAIAQVGASSMADMGKVMGVLQGALAGKADMSQVSGLVRSALK